MTRAGIDPEPGCQNFTSATGNRARDPFRRGPGVWGGKMLAHQAARVRNLRAREIPSHRPARHLKLRGVELLDVRALNIRSLSRRLQAEHSGRARASTKYTAKPLGRILLGRVFFLRGMRRSLLGQFLLGSPLAPAVRNLRHARPWRPGAGDVGSRSSRKRA